MTAGEFKDKVPLHSRYGPENSVPREPERGPRPKLSPTRRQIIPDPSTEVTRGRTCTHEVCKWQSPPARLYSEFDAVHTRERLEDIGLMLCVP